jgi:hypothetical protein
LGPPRKRFQHCLTTDLLSHLAHRGLTNQTLVPALPGSRQIFPLPRVDWLEPPFGNLQPDRPSARTATAIPGTLLTAKRYVPPGWKRKVNLVPSCTEMFHGPCTEAYIIDSIKDNVLFPSARLARYNGPSLHVVIGISGSIAVRQESGDARNLQPVLAGGGTRRT